jgi:signal transduction histidine kinase
MKTKPQLLIVNDDPGFRILLAGSLEDVGFDATETNDSEEALRLIREKTFDLALLDVKMPNIDGIELLKILRKESPTTDCVMVAERLEMQLAIEAIKLGAKDFLLKPQNVEELVSRIKTIMRAHIAESHVKELQIEFTSKLLHDLLTPLHTLRSAIDFLEQETAGPLTVEQKKIFQSISSTIKTMSALLNDMIDLSLFESGHVSIEKIPTNLDELVPATCARFIPQATAKNIELTINVNENIPTVEVDPNKIEQAMYNLLENAIKYTRNGGHIKVVVSTIEQNIDGKNREYVEIVVSDSGIGIAKAELPFVFDKYKDFLTGKSPDQKTTRLGLAICRSIIEAHNGTMTVESELGKGSSFRFFLPTDSQN